MTILYSEPADVYHATAAISHSKLATFIDRPSAYYRRYVLKNEKEETDAMRLGSAFHAWMESPKAFALRYVEGPDARRNSKEWLKFEEAPENAGMVCLKPDEMTKLKEMAAGVQRNPIAAALLAEGKAEVTIRRTSAKYGTDVQCRFDFLGQNRGQLLKAGLPKFDEPYYGCDIKSTSSLDAFRGIVDNDGENRSRHFFDMGYQRQQAFYQWVAGPELGPTAFFFVAVESKEPFDCAVFQIPNEWADRAFAEIDRGMLKLRECLKSQVWPSGFEGVQQLVAPRWMTGAA